MPGSLLSTFYILAHLIVLTAYEIDNYHSPQRRIRQLAEGHSYSRDWSKNLNLGNWTSGSSFVTTVAYGLLYVSVNTDNKSRLYVLYPWGIFGTPEI